MEIFSTVLKKEIPENTVLSHDLLEGSYLRCGLCSDVLLMDGYPSSYLSFKNRLHRWIRGDTQILIWLKNKIVNNEEKIKNNPLNLLSKYKIFDNLVRSNLEISVVLLFLVLLVICLLYKDSEIINIGIIALLGAISISFSTILEIINKITCKKNGEKKQKTFTKEFSNMETSIIRGILAFATLPDKAYFSVNGIVTSIYRMKISKKYLLEWTTSEEAEKISKKDLISFYKNMIANVIFASVCLIFVFCVKSEILKIILIFATTTWYLGPFLMWKISGKDEKKEQKESLNKEEKEYLYEIGRRTWRFFKENINEKTKYLPPDNFQENRKEALAMRTSPTNIGLAMLACISAYDLKYENLENTISILKNMLNTVELLQKWNGHLYNWYNLETLEPLYPRYISSVDNGNFVGYLYVVKQFFIKNNKERQYSNEIKIIDNLINMVDFTMLYDEKNRLFSIGFNIEENKLTDSYYDLLASEARQTSFVAIAKKDIKPKNWYNLSRTLTTLNKYKGLISWSATAFEYLMPSINIPQIRGSLIDESCKFMIMSQMEYAKKLKIPWGISESCFSTCDLKGNYQYKAFGIPWLGIKRGLEDEIVVSSYASILAITEKPKEVVANLKKLEMLGMLNKYGFYEAIDFTPSRQNINNTFEICKTYMAHHQGLILLSINNLFNNFILQKRFMENPEMQSVKILLEERMPENMIVAKEVKEKIKKIKYKDYETYSVRTFNKINEDLNRLNVISNGEYSVILDQKGNGYSKYKDILINRFKSTSDISQGIFFYLKNVKTKKIWTANYMNFLAKPDSYKISFMPDKCEISRKDGSIETKQEITVSPESPVEIRHLEFKNNGNEKEMLELTAFLEPVISTKEQDYSHQAFNNLFLTFKVIDGIIVAERRKRGKNETKKYLAVSLYTNEEKINGLEYELDKEKFFGRENLEIPNLVFKSSPFSSNVKLTVDPCIAIKQTFSINPEEKKNFDLIISIADKEEIAVQNVKKYFNEQKIKQVFELSKTKVEAENRYLGLTAKKIEVYQKMLSYLLMQNHIQEKKFENLEIRNVQNINIDRYKFLNSKQKQDELYSDEKLWPFGISGDNPILVIKIKNINDIYVVSDCLKAYEFFRTKNIFIDLVIINEEENSYDKLVKNAIDKEILNNNMNYLLNQNKGIFVLNNLDKKDVNLLEIRANLFLDSHNGKIGLQLKDMEEEYIENKKSSTFEIEKYEVVDKKEIKIQKQELKYDNEYGGFSKDGKEYKIKINKNNILPSVWCNILANEHFGTLVTASQGGYTWSENSRLNKLTSWQNNSVQDIPSEIIYLEDEDTNLKWSLGSRNYY